MLWPTFNPCCQLKNRWERSANQPLIDRRHRASEWHRSEIDGLRTLPHCHRTGVQLVVTRKPRRRCAVGLRATASCTVSTSSRGVKPRITETTPSWRSEERRVGKEGRRQEVRGT